MEYTRARLNMINNQLRPNGVDDPRVLDAMAHVPRERVVPKALRGVAYADEDLPLPGGNCLIEPLVLGRPRPWGRCWIMLASTTSSSWRATIRPAAIPARRRSISYCWSARYRACR